MSNRSAHQTDRRPTGRPALPEDEVRCQRLVTMVTQPEFKRLSELAANEHSTMSSFVHDILLKFLAKENPTEGNKK